LATIFKQFSSLKKQNPPGMFPHYVQRDQGFSSGAVPEENEKSLKIKSGI